MSKRTTNFNLMMPELTDSPPDITATNPNWEKIDAELYRYFVNTATSDAYEITINGIATYSDLQGIPILVKTTIANTTGCTLNVNGLGAVNIVRGTGASLLTGDITAGKIVQLVYDGTNFQLLSQGVDVSQATKTETLTNKTLASPTLQLPRFSSAGYIADANGHELIKFPSAVTSPVNEITVSNAVTGASPTIQSSGEDANIGLILASKGNGVIRCIVNGVISAIHDAAVSAVNYLKFTGNVAGSNPTITAAGTDTNIGIDLVTKGNGTVKVNGVAINSIADSTSNGLMSYTDKIKLDGVENNANNYIHPVTSGNKHIPAGGDAGQYLKYSAAGTAAWATPTKADVGLGSVDNTSDANKPVSTATQTALNGKAPLASPNFTGMPTVSSGMMYHVGNITISTAAPGSALTEGAQHQVY